MKKLFIIILIFTFLSMFFSFGYFLIKEYDFIYLFPCIIGFIGVVFSIYFFVEMILGDKIYYFQNEKIYVKRNDKIITIIEKADIKNLVFIYDILLENLYMICFEYNSKKYHITINQIEDTTLTFFEGIKYTIKKNHWYYFFEFFSIWM